MKVELLDRERILADLSESVRQGLAKLEIFTVIDSTNRYALEQSQVAGPLVCLAEYQTAGRGRYGRRWVSPYASGLCLSLKQRYVGLNYSLAGLSIATAVTVGQVLRAVGATEIGLKWPNDVVWRGRKLAGLLLESRSLAKSSNETQLNRNSGFSQYPIDVVIGIGLNLQMPIAALEAGTAPLWTDLHTVLGYTVSRNQLAAQLIEQGLQTLANYPYVGIAPFLRQWPSFDIIYGQQVTITMPQGNGGNQVESVTGIASGVDEEGALWLQVGKEKRRYRYGEVSVRL